MYLIQVKSNQKKKYNEQQRSLFKERGKHHENIKHDAMEKKEDKSVSAPISLAKELHISAP